MILQRTPRGRIPKMESFIPKLWEDKLLSCIKDELVISKMIKDFYEWQEKTIEANMNWLEYFVTKKLKVYWISRQIMKRFNVIKERDEAHMMDITRIFKGNKLIGIKQYPDIEKITIKFN
jgi:hypothetical protein